MDNEKENSSTELGHEAITPMKAHQQTIPETPSPLLPSISGTRAVEKKSPRRFLGLVKKRRQCARIESSDEEENRNSTETKEIFCNTQSHKRRKLAVSFNTTKSFRSNSIQENVTVENDPINDQISISHSIANSDTDSSPEVRRKRKRKKPRSAQLHSDTEPDTPTCTSAVRNKPIIGREPTVSSGWLSSSKRKLEKFSYKKESSQTTNSDEEIAKKPSKRKNKKKKILIESDSDDDDCVVLTTDEQLRSEDTKQITIPQDTTKQITIHHDTTKQITIPDECDEDDLIILDQYSGPKSDDDGFTARQKRSILQFLNEASLEELSSIPGCSVNKAALVDKSKPFQNWGHLVSETSENRTL